MASRSGTKVIAPLVTPDTVDNFGTAYMSDIVGGFLVVADNTARDAIKSALRAEGMWVKTLDSGKVWQLASNLTTWNEKTFGVQEMSALIGGFMVVADNTARDAISNGLRVEGMWALTLDTGKVWQLGNDLVSWTEKQFESPFSTVTITAATTYNVTGAESVIFCRNQTPPYSANINFPSAVIAALDRIIYIKDRNGLSAITITTEGSETIDGATELFINVSYAGVGITSDGSNLYII